MVASTIREWLNEWDKYISMDENDEKKIPATRFNNVYIGAAQKKQSLAAFEETLGTEEPYQNFKENLNRFLYTSKIRLESDLSESTTPIQLNLYSEVRNLTFLNITISNIKLDY